MVRAQEGDHDAFSEITMRSIGRLTAAARLILHDEYRAQDAVQDALFEAWRDIRGMRDPDRFDAWIHRLLVRACYRHAKRAWGRDQVEVPLVESYHTSVAEGQAALEARDELERGLRRLTPDQRAVLVLTYYVDLPLSDAADALGIPVGTMKSRLNRATAALHAALDAQARVPVASEATP